MKTTDNKTQETDNNTSIDAEWLKGVLKKRNRLLQCLRKANAEIGKLIEENYYLKEYIVSKWSEEDEVTKEDPCENCKHPMLNYQNFPCIEKQGEQKPTDKVEPKFKVGDWITNGEEIGQVIEWNHPDCIGYKTTYGTEKAFNKEGISKWHKWTIQDAKDGDVLVCIGKYGQEIGIVKKYVGKYGGCDKCFESYCFVDWDGIFRTSEYMGSKEIHPATKEQRDQLEKAITEAGYTFDFDKKELKKIKNRPLLSDFLNAEYERGKADALKCVGWSEDDKGNLLDVKCIVDKVWHNQDFREDTGYSTEELESLWNWLDSIWQKVEYPQNTWKPSDEQMQVLTWCLPLFADLKLKEILKSLIDELKKL